MECECCILESEKRKMMKKYSLSVEFDGETGMEFEADSPESGCEKAVEWIRGRGLNDKDGWQRGDACKIILIDSHGESYFFDAII
jgi:hypothetical protein